jgi:DNA-binding response OmpR family regulator
MGTPEQSDRSTDSNGQDAKILLVDDEPELVETYAIMLGTEYTVLTATNGSEALDQVDDTVDIVFLDRRMPDMSGDKVLAKLRQQGYDMPIAMLTAVDPAEDIADMPFDDYITKPVDRSKLFEKVNILLNRSEFDDTSRELYSLASKKAVLEASGIDDSNREIYQQICAEMDELRGKIDETLDDLFEDEPDAAFRNL